MLGLLTRRSVLTVALGAAIGIPYVVNHPEWRAKGEALWSSIASEAANLPEASFSATGTDPSSSAESGQWDANGQGFTPASLPGGKSLPDMLTGPPVQDLSELLRFDITPQWILSRWSRVTTVLAEYELEGLRVPLVSGTQLDDVAGSLTYYYDKQHRLQRISFEGHTGDYRRFVAAAVHQFGLHSEPSLYASMYLAKWNGRPKSALIVRHAAVVSSAAPHSRMEILMEINRPENYYDLSLPMRGHLQHGQHSSRWGT